MAPNRFARRHRADCTAFNEVACTDCGNDTAEDGEDCDGIDLRDLNCVDLGFVDGGDLACSGACTYDTSSCTNNTCGDGVVQGSDVCDCGDLGAPCTVDQLGGLTCADLDVPGGGKPYDGGELACESPNNCTAFDVAACYYCGDGRVDTGEDCDGEDLNNASCASLGHLGGGTLACTMGCVHDESDCRDLPNPYRICDTQDTEIVDEGTITRTLVLEPAVPVADVDVELEIDHLWVGDLRVTLRHDDRSIRIVDQVGVPATSYGCGNDNMNITLDDEALLPVEDQCSGGGTAVLGTFRPNESLSELDGSDSSGNWRLDVRDMAALLSGTLRQCEPPREFRRVVYVSPIGLGEVKLS